MKSFKFSMPNIRKRIPILRQRELLTVNCPTKVYWPGRIRRFEILASLFSKPASRVSNSKFSQSSRKTLTTLAVPDLFLATFLASLYTGAPGDLLRISRGSFPGIAALVFGNFRERPASEDRSRCNLGNILIGRVIVSMLY